VTFPTQEDQAQQGARTALAEQLELPVLDNYRPPYKQPIVGLVDFHYPDRISNKPRAGG
jgi:hypothetical protein